MTTAFIGAIACLAYLSAAVFLLLRIQGRKLATSPRANVLGIQLPAILAYVAHTALIVDIFISGLNFAFFDSLALFAWIINGIFMLSTLKWPLTSLGVLVYPIAGICALLYSLVHQDIPSSANIVLSPLLQAHIISSVFAYALLSLASLQAIIFAIQDHQIHHHKPGGYVRSLPPLQTMERLLFKVISVGFVLLSIAVATGFAVVGDWFTHKIIFSVIAWLIFAVLLTGRKLFGWRGSKAVRLTLSGIVFLILSFFGSKLVLELILGR